MPTFSVLDQSTAVRGQAPDQAIRDTIALAKHCEDLGYARFWVSEHHDHPSIVGTAPEIVMAAVAQSTDRIRIGSAGVMLPHYAPLKVAEQFRVLEAIAPGRIDLGLGRAPGSDGKTALALNPNAGEDAEHFPANVRDLMAWVSGEELMEGHPFRGVEAHPMFPGSPEVWMLGTSDYGAQVAAHFGLPYCFAHFITDGHGTDRALALYRERYQPSERHPEPMGSVCIWALAAETEEEAERLFTSRAHARLMRETGRRGPMESPETLADWEYSEPEKAWLTQYRERAIIGTGEQVVDELTARAEVYGVDEVVVLTWTYHQEDRRRSYELLAAAQREKEGKK
ncbi:MAG: LLM class flavin-dependent oxidoreductase [Rhodospirillaceae bacterium]|nr:LLM class flavin-dependent oxidoreductase [Rhodospirillaceae bacterium]